MRIPAFARHLMHRKCSWCEDNGYRRGFLAASAEASKQQAARDAVWRQGIDPDRLEEYVRRAA